MLDGRNAKITLFCPTRDIYLVTILSVKKEITGAVEFELSQIQIHAPRFIGYISSL